MAGSIARMSEPVLVTVEMRFVTSDDPDALAELAQSIREHGVIQPLVVSRRDGDAGVYQLIAGERRLLASREAGLARVPVIVKEASPRALLELALVENLQRQDLGALEEAAAFRRLVDEFGLTQEAVAQRVGRSRSAVASANAAPLRVAHIAATSGLASASHSTTFEQSSL